MIGSRKLTTPPTIAWPNSLEKPAHFFINFPAYYEKQKISWEEKINSPASFSQEDCFFAAVLSAKQDETAIPYATNTPLFAEYLLSAKIENQAEIAQRQFGKGQVRDKYCRWRNSPGPNYFITRVIS
jgi:hypothetical protein